MKILVVTNMWPTADDPTFGVFVQEQVDSVRALGHEIDVFVIAGRKNRVNYLRAIATIRGHLTTGQYDIVHAHYVLTGLVAWAAGVGRRGPPLVVTHHGVEVFAGWQAPLSRWLCNRADRTLVISGRMAEHLHLGEDAVVPCGVDLELFCPGSRTDARRELELDDQSSIVAWVGVDRPEKRLALARDTVSLLQRDLPNAFLHVVSDRPHADVPAHIRAADAVLVTSTWEGGPLVVKEALACNRPVVSTDVGDVPELIDGLPGCAIVEGEPRALAAALSQAVAVGKTPGRARVRQYSLGSIAERLVAVYARTAGRAPTTANTR